MFPRSRPGLRSPPVGSTGPGWSRRALSARSARSLPLAPSASCLRLVCPCRLGRRSQQLPVCWLFEFATLAVHATTTLGSLGSTAHCGRAVCTQLWAARVRPGYRQPGQSEVSLGSSRQSASDSGFCLQGSREQRSLTYLAQVSWHPAPWSLTSSTPCSASFARYTLCCRR